MIVKLAWRNIWRNRRRTFITAASILFAVLFASLMESLQKGAWNNMINNVVNFYYGYAQIQQKGYWDDRTIDNAFVLHDSLLSLPDKIDPLAGIVPRLESFALASTGNKTFGVMVVGIDPGRENAMTGLADRVESGAYLSVDSEPAALLATGVAERLNLDVGDTIILISQGFHGVNAAGKYPVQGMVDFPSPDLNKQLLYLPLQEAQHFYGAYDRVTSLALNLKSNDDISPVRRQVTTALDTSTYQFMDWKAMMPELLEAKALDSAGNIIVYLILYLIIAFGIFGTILMMTKEREYEFGVLTAIGMRRGKLGLVIWLETVMLGLLGALSGILLSVPVVWYFKVNPIQFTGEYAHMMEQYGFEPIFPAQLDWTIFATQALLVFLVTALLALYPIWKIRHLQPVEAMHG